MRESTRLGATLIIWVIFAIVMSVTLTSVTGPISRAGDNAIFGIVALMAGMAAISTIAIWLGGGRSMASHQDATHLARGKRKRAGRDRIERLIEALDDEDIYDLEELLLAREDEPGAQHHP